MPAALLYCKSIIACAKAIHDVQLEDMGCSVGEYNINALELEDKMCICKSEKRIEILHENKESSRGRSEKEEGKAGKNKLWMRKVQPTKLGPSQQLFVNILLGKWLEMCSFEQNLPPKVAQIWPTGWLCYMISLWWLVTHPQKYIFLETVINRRVPKPISFQFQGAVNVVL